jgi:hypothetical protein
MKNMKKNIDKLLIWICGIVLVIVIYKYVCYCTNIELFKNPFTKKKQDQEKKNKQNMSIEEMYKIKDKKLDEIQTINVWDISWVKDNIDKKSLQKLWKTLIIDFPK